MKIRGYLTVYDDATFYFYSNRPTSYVETQKVYTFEIDVPHPLPELKVDVTTIKEVTGEQKETEKT